MLFIRPSRHGSMSYISATWPIVPVLAGPFSNSHRRLWMQITCQKASVFLYRSTRRAPPRPPTGAFAEKEGGRKPPTNEHFLWRANSTKIKTTRLVAFATSSGFQGVRSTDMQNGVKMTNRRIPLYHFEITELYLMTQFCPVAARGHASQHCP